MKANHKRKWSAARIVLVLVLVLVLDLGSDSRTRTRTRTMPERASGFKDRRRYISMNQRSSAVKQPSGFIAKFFVWSRHAEGERGIADVSRSGWRAGIPARASGRAVLEGSRRRSVDDSQGRDSAGRGSAVGGATRVRRGDWPQSRRPVSGIDSHSAKGRQDR